MDNYLLLAEAIIAQAAEDYARALRGEFIRGRKPERMLAEVRRFFFSDWYALMTNVDPHYLVEQLEKNYANECRFLEEARRHKGNELYQKYYFECPVCHNPVAYVRIGKRRNSYVCNQEKIWISKQE